MNAPLTTSGLKPDTGALIANLARERAVAQAEPRTGKYLDAAPYIILRDANGDERVEYITGRTSHPARKTGHAKLFDVDSFCWYYGQHGNGAPVYATLEPAQFLAVLNDHTKDAPGYRDYRVDFTPRLSKEWTTWTKHNGHGAAFGSTESFALFLEDNAPDIARPDAAVMMQIALNFRIHQGVQFQQAQRLQDGQINFGYVNTISTESKSEAGKKLQIPEVFEINVPVFEGVTAPKYKVEARFRYRLHEAKLTLWYELVRPHKVVETAFREVWDKIVKQTKAPILLGKPD